MVRNKFFTITSRSIVMLGWVSLVSAEAASFKAMPLGGDVSVTVSAEARLRFDAFSNGQSTSGNDYQQGLFRGVIGGDLRCNPNFHMYAEIGTGQVAGHNSTATPNFQNDVSLQQLFVDASGTMGTTLIGAMIGRQEFTDGPRQLISLSDGPNIHRTWNGLRMYGHNQRIRVSAFELRATLLGRGSLDEEINYAERLRGLNASLLVFSGSECDIYLDPFWLHSENPNFRSGSHVGLDDRNTVGVRLWETRGSVRFDWTLVHQTGKYIDRDVDAWGLFTVQSLTLSGEGWKPHFTTHIDMASGGGTYETGTLKGFNHLYASSGYLGEGQFFSLSNLLMIAPGFSVSPSPTTNLSMEYDYARRLNDNDAAYAGGMRAYAGTQNVQGQEIGSLLRVAGTLSVSTYLTLFFDYEQLIAGDVLKRAHIPSGSYGYVGATFRY